MFGPTGRQLRETSFLQDWSGGTGTEPEPGSGQLLWWRQGRRAE